MKTRMSSVALRTSYKEDYTKRQELIFRICNFMKNHPQTKLRQDQIMKILRLCRNCCQNFTLPRTFTRQVLSYIAQRMFCSDFKDSECVSLLLNMVFRNDCCISLLLPGADQAIKPEDHHLYVAYFLEHAYRRKVLFNGYRISCVEVYDGTCWQHPVQFAACTFNVPLLRVLLRYGALLSYDVNYEDRSVKRRPYGWNGLLLLTWILPSIVDLNPSLLELEKLNLEAEDQKRYESLLRCCALILSDLPRWSTGFLKSVYYQGKYLRNRPEAAQFVRDFSDRVMPGLDQHFTEPLDLVAACRNVIRKRLNERWLLPSGIDHLPLPRIMKQYLDSEIA